MTGNHSGQGSLRSWVPWILVLGTAWVAQVLAWRASFYMDDFHHILTRGAVTGEEPMSIEWKGRFLTILLWRAVYGVFGPDPVAFHGLNWFLHGVVSLFAFGVMRGFCRCGPPQVREDAASLGLWGSLLFAAHPVAVEPVHYASQTSILLAVMLSLAAAGLFLRWRANGRLRHAAGAAALVLLAGMAKEAGFWHALILLFFLALPGRDRMQRDGWHRDGRMRLAILGLAGAVSIVCVHAWLGTTLIRLENPAALTHHWLTQARVLGEYLRLLWIPSGLSSDHHVAWTIAWTDGEAVLKLVGTAVAAVWILERYLRARRWLAALFGMILFHLLLRFAYPVDEPMVEYRLYPSLPWFGLLVALALREIAGWRFPRLSRLATPILVVMLGCLVTLTWRRSRVWESERALVTDVIFQYPLNLRALGIYYKNLMLDGQADMVVMSAELPDMIHERIVEHNAGSDRLYSERRLHLDYASCQYYIIRGLLHVGEVKVALERSETLLRDLITGRRPGGEDSYFTALLSRALCLTIMGRREGVEETWRMAHPLMAESLAAELPGMLEAELSLLEPLANVSQDEAF